MPQRIIDIAGLQFGRLTARTYLGNHKWLCECQCGNRTRTESYQLRSGKTRSCGCLMRELADARARTHGASLTPEYRAWRSMIDRCTNPNNHNWRNYGARGITIAPQWRHSFETFLADVGSRPSEEMSLDRINNAGHYEPGNVRWASLLTQHNNTRRTVLITHNGRTQSIAQWERELGFRPDYLRHRIRHRGLSFIEAIDPAR